VDRCRLGGRIIRRISFSPQDRQVSNGSDDQPQDGNPTRRPRADSRFSSGRPIKAAMIIATAPTMRDGASCLVSSALIEYAAMSKLAIASDGAAEMSPAKRFGLATDPTSENMTTKVPPASPFRTSTARSLAPKRNRRLIRWATDCEVNLRIANPVPHSVNDTGAFPKSPCNNTSERPESWADLQCPGRLNRQEIMAEGEFLGWGASVLRVAAGSTTSRLELIARNGKALVLVLLGREWEGIFGRCHV
jgi:hypothetical protein